MKIFERAIYLTLLLSELFFCNAVLAAQTQVLITVDVESFHDGNPDKQIWGKTEFSNEEHGIAKIIEILDSRKAKATFYLNVYEMAKHGEKQIRHVAEAIHESGHDLQLHTHPNDMFGYGMYADIDKQKAILEVGIDLIEKWTGKKVIAHRAGGYQANLDTLTACQAVGIMVDSSLSPASGTMLARQMAPVNHPVYHNGILEIPVSYYIQAKFGSWESRRIVDLEASTYYELKSVLEQFRDRSTTVVNIMMHSFSFVRYGKPDYALEKRFEKLLDFINQDPDVVLSTTSEFYSKVAKNGALVNHRENFVPYTGWLLTYLRAVEDYDKGWKNVAVALSPVMLSAIIVVFLFKIIKRKIVDGEK